MVLVVSEPVSEPRLTQLAISYYQKEQSNRMFIRTIRDEWSDWRELSSTDQLCNPNLLDNWYFPNPVNQRGLTEYTAAGYTVDRWKLLIDATNLLIKTGYISLTAATLDYGGFMQLFEAEPLLGQTVTFSVLCRYTGSGGNILPYITAYCGDNVYDGWSQINSTDWMLASFTHTFPETKPNDNRFGLDIVTMKSFGVDIKAVKLELGDTQTLAHKEGDIWVLNEIPDFGDQLARCQRYCVKLGSSTEYEIVGTGTGRTSSICGIVVPIPVTMRAIPVAILSGQLILRNRDDANIVCTSVTVDVNGAGAMYLACTANDVTVGASYDAYLAPGNYLYLGADL